MQFSNHFKDLIIQSKEEGISHENNKIISYNLQADLNFRYDSLNNLNIKQYTNNDLSQTKLQRTNMIMYKDLL